MMKIFDYISKLLISHKITLFAPIALSDCHIVRPYLLERAGISDGTAIICAIPYLSPSLVGDHNISSYCAVKDYHAFFNELKESMLKELRNEYPDNLFEMFADHSPIDERDAAAGAGLGVFGLNGMLITEEYSSYVFLGELVTDAHIPAERKEIRYCIGCGKCKKECPMDELGECLSAITQKKGELTKKEKDAIIKYNSAWGCDICQKICPYTENAIKNGTIYTNIDYFLSDIIPDLDSNVLNLLDESTFKSRAFAWRGRTTVERNLKILERKS